MTPITDTIKERLAAERDEAMRKIARLRREIATVDEEHFSSEMLEGARRSQEHSILADEKERRLQVVADAEAAGHALEASDAQLQIAAIDQMAALVEEATGVSAALSTLRMLLGAFAEAETSGKGRRALSEDDSVALLKSERKKRLATAQVYADAGRHDREAAELAEVEVIERFLPARATTAEVRAFVAEYVAENHLPSAGAAVGQVMRALRARFADFDGAEATRAIRAAVAPVQAPKEEG